MPLWIAITIAAAFLQNIRSAMQKHLKSRMGTTGATFVRFGFGAPFAFLILAALHFAGGYALPVPNTAFFLWGILAAFSQIAAQFLLVMMFSYRNFTVGTAYSRTEPAQAALFGLVFLGESAGNTVLVAIAVTVIGVMIISVARGPVRPGNLITSLGSRAAVIGLLSGAIFGVAAVGYRAASLSLAGPNFMMQAAMTLAFAITLQTLVMLIWMMLRDRDELARVIQAWRPSLVVGLAGATASFGWFMAMTLQQAAIVKALAQIEMLFTFASSVFVFKEHVNRLEILGCILIVAGILILVLL